MKGLNAEALKKFAREQDYEKVVGPKIGSTGYLDEGGYKPKTWGYDSGSRVFVVTPEITVSVTAEDGSIQKSRMITIFFQRYSDRSTPVVSCDTLIEREKDSFVEELFHGAIPFELWYQFVDAITLPGGGRQIGEFGELNWKATTHVMLTP